MSIKVMTAVWDSAVSAPERFTLLALADAANDDGWCWPSVRHLAKKVRAHESTIQRHLSSLVDSGLVVRRYRSGSSTVYRVLVAALPMDADEDPDAGSEPPADCDPPQIATPRDRPPHPPVNCDPTPPQIATQNRKGTVKEPSIPAETAGEGEPEPELVLDVPVPSEAKPDPLDGFADFYAAYPRKEDRRDAERAWRAARKRGVDPQLMIDAARTYAASCRDAGTERRFMKYPATWLNKGAYANETATAAPSGPETVESLRDRADAVGAARLIRGVYVETPRPPGDPTPQLEWARRDAVAYIDAHEDKLRAVLGGERRTG